MYETSSFISLDTKFGKGNQYTDAITAFLNPNWKNKPHDSVVFICLLKLQKQE